MELSTKLLAMNHIQHAFSCARFAVCISSHGTSKTAANCLLHLGEMLQQHSDEMHVMETKEEGEDSPSHSHQTSNIFNELNEKKPRWIQLPLSYRISCSCAKTGKDTAMKAMQIDPSCGEAWSKFQEWS